MTKDKLDKIAKRYAQDELKNNHGQVEDIVAAAFLNGIDYAENHPHWISVEDELPPKDGRYIFYLDTTGVMESYYYAGILLNEHVTHWMALPSPPEHFADVSKKISGCPEIPNNHTKTIEKGGEQ